MKAKVSPKAKTLEKKQLEKKTLEKKPLEKKTFGATEERTNEEVYQMMEDYEHILSENPDMYVGSIEATTTDQYVYYEEAKKIIKKKMTYSPALLKIYDEIIVNVRDQTIRQETCNEIYVTIDKQTGYITVKNNGNSIPVQIHKETNIYIPEMIFFHLRTSSNFNTTGKIVGGKNGFGAKLTNIFSKHFIVDIIGEGPDGKLCSYHQEFKDNMGVKEDPIIKKLFAKDKAKPMVSISFLPDYQRLGLKGLSDDIHDLLVRRVYDLVAITNDDVQVYLNDVNIPKMDLLEYSQLYFDESILRAAVYGTSGVIRPGEKVDRWRFVAIFDAARGGTNVSFVNGIHTLNGGTHVEYISEQIATLVVNKLKRVNKEVDIQNKHVRENIVLFLDCVIEDPKFNGQSKEKLESPIKKFGSECEIAPLFIKKLLETGLGDAVIETAKLKSSILLKKIDGKKNANLDDIEKLEDAKFAGGKHSTYCSLILIEGDSAKEMAMSGLQEIGKDYYGIFPLKGKLMNVKKKKLVGIDKGKSAKAAKTLAGAKKAATGKEIENISRILGLKHNIIYNNENLKDLRYGSIIILTDQDDDGSHIKGLVMNLIHTYWPSLLYIKGFIRTLSTPLIISTKGLKNNMKREFFYTVQHFNKWLATAQSKGYKAKYYKGLATYDPSSAREQFVDFEERLINFVWTDKEQLFDPKDETEIKSMMINSDNECNGVIKMVFDLKNEDKRKEWLLTYDPNDVLAYDASAIRDVTIPDFFNKDMKHFSYYSFQRAIPSILDGFKPSQRKIFFTLSKDYLGEANESKVSILASNTSGKTKYHHGEASLISAIINMAQNYPGGNNINLLHPSGQFGSRHDPGAAGQPRYIFSYANQIGLAIFNPEDEPLYEYNESDGERAEYKNYSPIIPFVLVNGTIGVGTGFSTNIPPYNIVDLIDYITNKLNGSDTQPLKPYFRKIKTPVGYSESLKKYYSYGDYEVLEDSTVVRITELPANVPTYKYVQELKKLTPQGLKNADNKLTIDDAKRMALIKSVRNDSVGALDINIRVEFEREKLMTLIKEKRIKTALKLLEPVPLTNMHLIDANGNIKKYYSPEEIIDEFMDHRMIMYNRRHEYILKDKLNRLNIIKYKVQFIEEVNSEEIILKKSTKKQILEVLEARGYPKTSPDPYASAAELKYDYLDSISPFHFTTDELAKLRKKQQEELALYESYKKKTPKILWEEDLQVLSETYVKFLEKDFEYDHKGDKKGPKGKGRAKGKTITPKAKMQIENNDEEQNEE